MSARAANRALTGEQLQELLGLLRSADTTELKVTVPESQRYATLRALDVDPLDAQIRQVFFLDTLELALDRAGVVARARRVQASRADTVIKLRPVVPESIDDVTRRDPSFGVEVDAMPGGFVCSASFKGTSTNEAVRGAVAGDRPLRKLFSKQQRSFYAAHAPEGIALDDLSVLGPVTVFKLKVAPTGFARKLTAELWNYPDGSRILELSPKCRPTEAFQVAAETRAFLSGRGLDLSGRQQTKTRAALTYFAKELARAPAAAAGP
jgi:hypothetical protein